MTYICVIDHSLSKLLLIDHWINGVYVVFMQWTCLILCLASIFVQNSVLSAYMLMAGVATSRLGLWMFDLAVIQQMQVEKYPEIKLLLYTHRKLIDIFLLIIEQVIFAFFFSCILTSLFSFSQIGSCSWIWSRCCGRCSELAAVYFGLDDLCHGYYYLQSTGDLFKDLVLA